MSVFVARAWWASRFVLAKQLRDPIDGDADAGHPAVASALPPAEPDLATLITVPASRVPSVAWTSPPS
jgi:hypothetical protein